MSTQMIAPSQDQAALTALVSKLSSPIVEQARTFEVESSEDYEMAATFMQMLATKKRALTSAFDIKNAETCHPIVLAAYRAKVAAADAYDEVLKPKTHGLDELEQARSIVSGKVLIYDTKAAEAKRKQEAADAAVERKRLEDAALVEAEQLRASGDSELADLVLENAANAPAPVVVLPKSTPAVGSMMRTREDWKFEVINEEEVIKNYPDLCSADPVKIGAMVRSQKKLAVGKWKGIRVWCEKKFHGRTA